MFMLCVSDLLRWVLSEWRKLCLFQHKLITVQHAVNNGRVQSKIPIWENCDNNTHNVMIDEWDWDGIAIY